MDDSSNSGQDGNGGQDGGQRPVRPWWRKKRWWAAAVFAVLALLVACAIFIPRFPWGPWPLYADLTPQQRADRIPYESLADETTRPFTHGQKAEEYKAQTNQPGYPRHQPYIEKYPSVRDCLVASERDAADPDLRLIDWDALYYKEAFDVCAWRIFSSLGTPDRVAKWLEFHGFKVRRSPHSHDRLDLNGRRSRASYRDKVLPNHGLLRFAAKALVYGYGFQSIWLPNGKLDEANYYADIL